MTDRFNWFDDQSRVGVQLRGPGFEQTKFTATSRWLSVEEIAELATPLKTSNADALNPLYYRRGSLLLGDVVVEDDAHLIGWKDDRHAITVAGSRAGKGVSSILPNLRFYPGSVFCIDPKGENARKTATERSKAKSQGGLGQKVFVLDPFDISGVPESLKATFDPLSCLDRSAKGFVEEVMSIADSLIVTTDPKNAHWDESARGFIEALIIHVVTADMRGRPRSLATVRMLLTLGDELAAHELSSSTSRSEKELVSLEFPSGETVSSHDHQEEVLEIDPFEALLYEMTLNESFDGVVAGQANKLNRMGIEERGSVLSFAERHTKFLEGREMRAVVSRSMRNLDLSQLKSSSNGITVYLCLPARYLVTHARWLRLVLSSTFLSVEKDESDSKSGVPVLAILDEFPILGNLRTIENAVGYIAGFDLKLWVFLQDLGQLKRDYPNSWETFLGNASVKQFFGNTDKTTLDYISEQLGMTEFARQMKDESISNSTGSSETPLAQARQYGDKFGTQKKDLLSRQEQKSDTVSQRTEIVRTALMTPDEASIYFRREEQNQLLLLAGWRPIILNRLLNYELEGTEIRRRNRSKTTTT